MSRGPDYYNTIYRESRVCPDGLTGPRHHDDARQTHLLTDCGEWPAIWLGNARSDTIVHECGEWLPLAINHDTDFSNAG